MKAKELITEIYNRALYYLTVPKCLCCGEPLEYTERAICAYCRREYEEQKKRNCSRCSKDIPKCTCSNFFLERHYLKKLIKVYRYSPAKRELPGNMLIYSLKNDNRRDTFSFLADELSAAITRALDIKGREEEYIITNVPRRSRAVREAGYDHSAVLAKRVAKLLGIEYAQFLKSKAKCAQKDTRGYERRKNAAFDYRRGVDRSLKGKTVIIVDDIVTTGSSMASCATLIRGMGTRRIVGATLSIAYKDSYIKPIVRYEKHQ